MTLLALGIDAGYASLGWAVVDVTEEDAPRIWGLGVIRTVRAKTKLVRDSDHERFAQISRGLLDIFEATKPAVICAETLSVAPILGITTAKNMGRVWGIIDMLAETHKTPLLMRDPKAIKMAVTGKAMASKEDMKTALDAKFSGELVNNLSDIKAKTQHEHPVDAVGAIIACAHGTELRLLRSAWRAVQ